MPAQTDTGQDAGEAEYSPLLAHLLHFHRALGDRGVRPGLDTTIDAARGLMVLDLGRREDFKHALRCVFVRRREDVAIFDEEFERFWQVQTGALEDLSWGPDLSGAQDVSEGMSVSSPRDSSVGSTARTASGASADGEEHAGEWRHGSYSWEEYLRTKDFGVMSHEELRATARLLRELDWAFAERRSRRSRHNEDGSEVDVRRSLRSSMSHGGELFDLLHRGPRTRRRPLILLCDVSGSMDRYTRLLLHFLHSVEHGRERTEVFVFATRLTRITQLLRHLDPDRAVAAVAGDVLDWSGGTRIGESLGSFNRQWSRRVMSQGAIVLIISDGWDRGDPDLLAAEMRRLQRTSYRTIWLNPLLGSPDYRPLTQGLQAALPYVDDFLPAHNVSSLSQLAEHLGRVQAQRPPRSSQVSRI